MNKPDNRLREITKMPGMFAPLEEWEAFATRIANGIDEYHEAERWLQHAEKEIYRLKALEAAIDMPAIKALILERLYFLEGLGFAPAILVDEPRKLEISYTNTRARRSVWIDAFYPLPGIDASSIKVSNLDGGSFWFRDWMARKGRPFDDARNELDMAGTVEHDTRLFEAEANSDMKEVLAGRAWEDVLRPED
jgi:hypothetical protein